MSEEEIDRWYQLGTTVGYEQLAAKYRAKAGKAFSLGQRKTADIYLEIADEIDAMAKPRRKAHDAKYVGEFPKC